MAPVRSVRSHGLRRALNVRMLKEVSGNTPASAAGSAAVGARGSGARVAAEHGSARRVWTPDTLPGQSKDLRAAKFSWSRFWYPVAVEKDVDPSRPYATMLLGLRLALWRHTDPKTGRQAARVRNDQHTVADVTAACSSAWQCVLDRCPHRAGPLSEGTVTSDGSLLCAYHGWSFGPGGCCNGIPQMAHDPKANATACSSSRACVTAFPVKVYQGLLWVWPEAASAATAAETPVASACGFLDDSGTAIVGHTAAECLPIIDWYVRDLPACFEATVENILDQSHAPFTHHNVAFAVGTPSKLADKHSSLAGHFHVSGAESRPVDDVVADNGHAFRYDVDMPMFNRGVAPITFTPPGNINIARLMFHVTPLSPGWVRVFMHDVFAPEDFPPDFKRGLLPIIKLLYARYVGHVLLNPLVDGDIVLTHALSKETIHLGVTDWAKRSYLPASADRGTVMWYSFLNAVGGGPFAPAAVAQRPELQLVNPGIADADTQMLPRMEILNRWKQHTKNCSSCRKVDERLAAATSASGAVAFVATSAAAGVAAVDVFGLCAAGQAPMPVLAWGLLVTAAASGVLLAALVRFQKGLHESDFTHSDMA